MPAMEIAGLCLPLKPQKERSYEGINLMIDGFFGCNMFKSVLMPIDITIAILYSQINAKVNLYSDDWCSAEPHNDKV
jgi:hypothetical protein